MNSRGITRRQSRIFLITSLVLFITAEIAAEILYLWVIGNPSIGRLATYNRWGYSIPEGLSVAGILLLASGLVYRSARSIAAMVSAGLGLMILSFVLGSMGAFNATIEYYPGYYWTLVSGPMANLFIIGLGTVIAAIVGYALRDTVTRNVSTS